MNIRDLEYLIAVAKHNSFIKASEECHVSQPTLSGQIKKLEDNLGAQIFERTTKRVSVTNFGKEIIKKAKTIIDKTDEIKNLSSDYKNPWHQPIKIGVIPSLGPYLIPNFLVNLRKNNKNSKIYIDEDITENITEKLDSRELDAILLATDIDKEKFEQIELFEEPFWVAYTKNSKLDELDEIKTGDLDLNHLLLLSDGHCLRDQIMEIWEAYDKNNNILSEYDTKASSLETLINLVAVGEGFTFVPALALQSAWTTDKGIQVRKLKHKKAYRKIRLVFRKNYYKKNLLIELSRTIIDFLPNTVAKL
jgi:LysR family hydrogen peroxide-inducible transcriptional activator